MKPFDKLLEEDIASYEGRHDDLIFQVPAFYRLLVNILDDPLLPSRLRPLVLAGIAYFILPVDVVPEDIYGPYGYVDDLFLTAFIAQKVREFVGSDEIIETNWDGEAPIIPLIQEILEREEELIGDKKNQIFQFIGLPILLGEPGLSK